MALSGLLVAGLLVGMAAMVSATREADHEVNHQGASYWDDVPLKKKKSASGQLKAWGWKIATLPFLTIIYVALISEGLRLLIPALGQPLWKSVPIPGFSYLRGYTGLHKLDVAHLMALFLLFAVWYSWVVNIRLLFAPHEFTARTGWILENYRWFVQILSITILVADALLFYCSMIQQGVWGSNAIFSFSALLATVCYTAILVFTSFVTVNLEE